MAGASTRAVVSADRRHQALELKKAGYGLREIGARLGISHQAVAKHLEKVVAEYRAIDTATVEDMRFMQNLQFDEQVRITNELIASAKKDPKLVLKAIDAQRKALDSKARLNGLNAPIKAELTGNEAGGGVFVLPLNGASLDAWSTTAEAFAAGEEAQAEHLLKEFDACGSGS